MPSEQGFTLIELIVVIALISILLFFSFPRFQGSVLRDDSEKSMRWVIYTVKMLRQDAVKHRKIHTLHVEMRTGTMWSTNESMSEEDLENARQQGYEFPEGMEILDVEFPDGEKISFGQAEVRFYPKGYSDRVMIHLQEKDDRQLTLLIEPFLADLKIYDTYVEFKN
ncbi:MAG: type II secretion system protein [Desulfococcus multivorans]|uniref:pilus assembly FimT family protein n=1 Tax=Desulfococcus sp. TaxID=2025834 RepID=UPI000403BEDA|nr:uncharacterized protein, prepilin domain [Desulfococcus multivorans]MDX9817282.1 type II secretion system protein [Desulfococcus multivorans]